MAYPKNPLGYPDHYFTLLSAARNNTFSPHISHDTYSICRERQTRWAGFRSSLLHQAKKLSLTSEQRTAYTDLHHLASGIKVTVTREPSDPNLATLSYTFRSSANLLASLMAPPGCAATQTLNAVHEDAIQHGTGSYQVTTPSPGGTPTMTHVPFADVNPSEAAYEQHRIDDLIEFRNTLCDRIKKGILTYQLSHPDLMGHPKIDFTPKYILTTTRWMAENTDYSPSLDTAEALTDLLAFYTDNPELHS